jgi:hypothetical protein
MGFSLLRRARRCVPVALLYLVLSQEALAVRRNIEVTKAFIGAAPRLSPETDVARRSSSRGRPAAFGARVVAMAAEGGDGKFCFGGICPSKATALAMTTLGLFTGAAQAARADDAMPPSTQVSQSAALEQRKPESEQSSRAMAVAGRAVVCAPFIDRTTES